MASFSQLCLLSALLVVLLINTTTMEPTITVSARSLPTEQTYKTDHNDHLTSLAVRLQSNGSSSSSTECWDSLIELQACTGEVIIFFLNGETHLGPDCCRAIHIIQHKCWPTMLGSLGFTPEESDILRGYCDATEAVGSLPPPPPAYVTSNVITWEDSRP